MIKLILFFISFNTFANQVYSIDSSHSLTIETTKCDSEHFIIENKDQYLAKVTCTTQTPKEVCLLQCKFKTDDLNGLIRVDDQARPFDISQKNEFYKGSTKRIINKRRAHVDYKPLINMGLIAGETAQVLNKGEFYLDQFLSLQYGLTDSLEFGLDNAALVSKNISTKFKYQFYSNQNLQLTLGYSPKYSLNTSQWAHQLHFYYDNQSNSKTINHFSIHLNLRSGKKLSDQTADDKIDAGSKIQSSTEYILDNWNRVIYGPSYNIALKAVGGHLGYIWSINNYHLAITLVANDIQNFEFDSNKGYFISPYLYYRY